MKAAREATLIFHPFYYDWIKYPIRGIDRYNYELYRALKKLRYPFKTLHSGYIKSNLEGVIKEILFPLRLLFNPAPLYHGTHALGAKWPILLARQKVIVTIHDLIPIFHLGKYNDRFFKYRYKIWNLLFTAKHAKHVIVPFRSTKDILVKDYGISPQKISVINYGVDLQTFYPKAEKGKTTNQNIFFVGELSVAKGVDTLIKAFAILKKKHPQLKLQLGSNGPDKELLVVLVNKLKLTNEVSFLGRIEEKTLRQGYIGSALSVFPSRYGFGLPAIEAMACGVPVIVGRALDSTDFVDREEMLTNPDDPEELAKKMEELLINPKLRAEVIKYGLKKAREHSWEKMARQTIRLYERYL